MKRIVLTISALMILPWLVMWADAWWWIIFGHTLTGHDWIESGRVYVATTMFFIAGFAAMFPFSEAR